MFKQLGSYWVTMQNSGHGFSNDGQYEYLTFAVTSYSREEAIAMAAAMGKKEVYGISDVYRVRDGVFDRSVFDGFTGCRTHPDQVLDVVPHALIHRGIGTYQSAPTLTNLAFYEVRAWCAACQDWSTALQSDALLKRALIGADVR